MKLVEMKPDFGDRQDMARSEIVRYKEILERFFSAEKDQIRNFVVLYLIFLQKMLL